jgi:hypothetical protein
MATASMSSILRGILTANPAMPNDEIISKAKAAGVNKPDSVIRHNLYNLKTVLKNGTSKASRTSPKSKAHQTSATKSITGKSPAPIAVQSSAARRTSDPKSVIAAKAGNNSVAESAKAVDLSSIFSNVAKVNEVIAACGGVDRIRGVTEAIRACGSLEAFLQHVDLVADLRGNPSA